MNPIASAALGFIAAGFIYCGLQLIDWHNYRADAERDKAALALARTDATFQAGRVNILRQDNSRLRELLARAKKTHPVTGWCFHGCGQTLQLTTYGYVQCADPNCRDASTSAALLSCHPTSHQIRIVDLDGNPNSLIERHPVSEYDTRGQLHCVHDQQPPAGAAIGETWLATAMPLTSVTYWEKLDTAQEVACTE